jgi:hypothetical protein
VASILDALKSQLTPAQQQPSVPATPPGSNASAISTLAGLTLLNVTSNPQPIPVGKGVTLLNQGTVPVILSTDPIVSPSNSWTLPPNGAAQPLTNPPVYISCASGSTTNVVVIPQILNLFNPNVLNTPSPPISLYDANVLVVEGLNEIFLNDLAIPQGIRTLAIRMEGRLTVLYPTLVVEGVSPSETTQIYRNNSFYLSEGEIFTAYVPVSALDNAVNIVSQGWQYPGSVFGEPGVRVTVEGDYNEYDDSVFYSGVFTTGGAGSAVAGTTEFLSGPVRLLSAQILTSGGASGNIQDSNTNGPIIAVAANGNSIITFPPKTILDASDSLSLEQIGAGAAQAIVNYAYP